MPVLHEATSGRAEALWQAQRIVRLQAEGVKLGQIAVVFRFKAAMEALEEALTVHGIPFQSLRTVKPKDLRWADEAVRILTAHSVKGLEFSHVFVGAIDAFDEAKHQSSRLRQTPRRAPRARRTRCPSHADCLACMPPLKLAGVR